jgi:hypothetical protein
MEQVLSRFAGSVSGMSVEKSAQLVHTVVYSSSFNQPMTLTCYLHKKVARSDPYSWKGGYEYLLDRAPRYRFKS